MSPKNEEVGSGDEPKRKFARLHTLDVIVKELKAIHALLLIIEGRGRKENEVV